jgi:hypothetical protein
MESSEYKNENNTQEGSSNFKDESKEKKENNYIGVFLKNLNKINVELQKQASL